MGVHTGGRRPRREAARCGSTQLLQRTVRAATPNGVLPLRRARMGAARRTTRQQRQPPRAHRIFDPRLNGGGQFAMSKLGDGLARDALTVMQRLPISRHLGPRVPNAQLLKV